MNITVTQKETGHLTAHDKKVICAILGANELQGSTKFKRIALQPTGENTYNVVIHSYYENTIGRGTQWNKHTSQIKVKL